LKYFSESIKCASDRKSYVVVERVSKKYIEELKRIISHCASPDAGGLTPSDFLLTDLSQRQLDELIDQLALSDD
jgi:non-ribosomal peptide synthase protein (TIGR01720 family)